MKEGKTDRMAAGPVAQRVSLPNLNQSIQFHSLVTFPANVPQTDSFSHPTVSATNGNFQLASTKETNYTKKRCHGETPKTT